MAKEKDDRPVERDARVRCRSKQIEKPGHTHYCRDTMTHEAHHLCVCGRKWEPVHG